mmetsp:Transcript_7764/g.25586  ORF Transcript_7764/g.25586 Transcript_7764/m.25586 type:complete len:597 (-) Transcript_7764:845-2635(-)
MHLVHHVCSSLHLQAQLHERGPVHALRAEGLLHRRRQPDVHVQPLSDGLDGPLADERDLVVTLLCLLVFTREQQPLESIGELVARVGDLDGTRDVVVELGAHQNPEPSVRLISWLDEERNDLLLLGLRVLCLQPAVRRLLVEGRRAHEHHRRALDRVGHLLDDRALHLLHIDPELKPRPQPCLQMFEHAEHGLLMRPVVREHHLRSYLRLLCDGRAILYQRLPELAEREQGARDVQGVLRMSARFEQLLKEGDRAQVDEQLLVLVDEGTLPQRLHRQVADLRLASVPARQSGADDTHQQQQHIPLSHQALRRVVLRQVVQPEHERFRRVVAQVDRVASKRLVERVLEPIDRLQPVLRSVLCTDEVGDRELGVQRERRVRVHRLLAPLVHVEVLDQGVAQHTVLREREQDRHGVAAQVRVGEQLEDLIDASGVDKERLVLRRVVEQVDERADDVADESVRGARQQLDQQLDAAVVGDLSARLRHARQPADHVCGIGEEVVVLLGLGEHEQDALQHAGRQHELLHEGRASLAAQRRFERLELARRRVSVIVEDVAQTDGDHALLHHLIDAVARLGDGVDLPKSVQEATVDSVHGLELR